MDRTTDVKVSYELVDTTAATDGETVLITGKLQDFSDIAELQAENQKIKKWATLEGEGFLLDGNSLLLPERIEDEFMGIWSQYLSDANGVLPEPVVLYRQFSQPHTSGGISFIFSEATEDWCSDLTIEWFDQNGEQMDLKSFAPDRGKYFCQNQVENYYGLKITFRKTNKPYHFLKVTGIRYGVSLDIFGDMLVSCSILEEVDPISAELSVNTMKCSFYAQNGEFNLLDLTGAYVLFQQRQGVTVTGIINGEEKPMGAFYLDKPTVNQNIVSMECIDLVGVIGDTEYLGGYWANGITVKDLVDDIMQSAGIAPRFYEISADLEDVRIRGYLPISSHRQALQQVAFAVGAIVDCSRSEKIKIRKISAVNKKTIPLDRKIVGHTQENAALVTGVEVYSHYYTKAREDTELLSETRTAGKHLIKFSKPAADISVSGATLLESGVNYAQILVKQSGMVTVTGYCYEDNTVLTGSVHIGELPSNAKANVKIIENCTLEANGQELAQRIYDHYQNRITDTGSIILDKEEVGDIVELVGNNEKNLVGALEQNSIDLTGGFIGKVVIRGGRTIK